MRKVSQHRNVVFWVFIRDLVTQLEGGGGGGGLLSIVAYTGRLHPKGVPSSFRYVKRLEFH